MFRQVDWDQPLIINIYNEGFFDCKKVRETKHEVCVEYYDNHGVKHMTTERKDSPIFIWNKHVQCSHGWIGLKQSSTGHMRVMTQVVLPSEELVEGTYDVDHCVKVSWDDLSQ